MIAEHIVYNNETEVFPRFKSAERARKAIVDDVTELQENENKFTTFLDDQAKFRKRVEKAVWGIFFMCLGLVGDMIWYWIKTSYFHVK